MAQYPSDNLTPDSFCSDLLRLHALFLSVIRFAVERHGGTLEKDPESGATYIDIPDWAEDACLQEIGNLVGPGKALHSYFEFLGE